MQSYSLKTKFKKMSIGLGPGDSSSGKNTCLICASHVLSLALVVLSSQHWWPPSTAGGCSHYLEKYGLCYTYLYVVLILQLYLLLWQKTICILTTDDYFKNYFNFNILLIFLCSEKFSHFLFVLATWQLWGTVCGAEIQMSVVASTT